MEKKQPTNLLETPGPRSLYDLWDFHCGIVQRDRRTFDLVFPWSRSSGLFDIHRCECLFFGVGALRCEERSLFESKWTLSYEGVGYDL